MLSRHTCYTWTLFVLLQSFVLYCNACYFYKQKTETSKFSTQASPGDTDMKKQVIVWLVFILAASHQLFISPPWITELSMCQKQSHFPWCVLAVLSVGPQRAAGPRWAASEWECAEIVRGLDCPTRHRWAVREITGPGKKGITCVFTVSYRTVQYEFHWPWG